MSCCLICYRNCDNSVQIYNEARKAKVKSEIKRFFKLLERYINGGNHRIKTWYPVELDELLEAGLLSCQDCHNQMEDFCDIYNVLEETEMILNWKMRIMKSAGNNNLLEGLKMLEVIGPGVDEVAKKVMEWRRMIAAKCNDKIQSSFPKLILKKCSLEMTCPELSILHNDPGRPLATGLNPSDNSNRYLDTNLDTNDILMERLGTEAQFNLEDIGEQGNRQNGTTIETTLHIILDNLELGNKRITTTNEMEVEHVHRETYSSYEKKMSIRNGIEEIHANNIMLSSDESELNSTESKSENLIGICKKKTAKNHSSANAKIDRKGLNLSRKYKADSDIVEFLTLPCQVEGCNKIFRNSNDFEDHKGHHGTFTCELCPSSFDYAPDLARHELSKHCEPKMKCPREGCAFKGKTNHQYIHHALVNHLNLKLAQSSRKFNCKICKTGFKQIGELRRHFPKCRIAAASTKPRVKCDVEGCTQSFKNNLVMKGHKQIKHFTGTKPTCQICRKTFDNKINLNYHIGNKHQEDLTIPCVVKSCKKKFVSENSLAAHVYSKHNTEKDKISKLCPHCGKKFIGSHSLQEHLKTHGRTKDFICEACGKGFRHRDNLNTHKLSHSGPESWNYQCKHCAKKCMTKQKLEEHLRTHGNEKPFVCDICGSKYAHRHNLRIHINNKHSDVRRDVARKLDKSNLSSRRKRKRKKIVETSSDSDSSYYPDSSRKNYCIKLKNKSLDEHYHSSSSIKGETETVDETEDCSSTPIVSEIVKFDVC